MNKKTRLLGKIARGFVAFVALLLLIIIGGAWWVFIRPIPNTTGQVTMRGLTQSVSVTRDKNNIPHIVAQNMNDAVRALGYIHASERFFQMELSRRAGAGRLSEVLGDSTIGIDKFTRTMGFYRLAQESFKDLSTETQNLFTAYAQGVNDWISSHKDKLPAEMTILRIKPEAWQVADSLVWARLMAYQLSGHHELDALRANLAGKISPQQMRDLFPGIMAPPPTSLNPEKSSLHTSLDALGQITGLRHAASNEWVVDGVISKTKKPILANDPHLDLSAPILWYLAKIITPNITLQGASVPGMPVILLGQNNHIAWGFTTTGSDTQDLFIETLDAEKPNHYRAPNNQSLAFDTRQEIIHVKDAPDIIMNVRASRHGPILSDIDSSLQKDKNHVMAFSFTGLGTGDKTAQAIVNISHATNWAEFKNALKDFRAPQQNIVYADKEGNIGFITPGLIPMRKKGNASTPVDGASGDYDWVGFVPFDDAPQTYNPPAHFIFNANNDLGYTKHFLGTDFEEPFRAKRLQEIFNQKDAFDLDDMAAIQADTLSIAAREILPFILKIQPTDGAEAQAINLLKNWNGEMDKNLAAPLIFEATMLSLRRVIMDSAITPDQNISSAESPLKDKGPFAGASLVRILGQSTTAWCEGGNCDKQIAQAFKQALDFLAQRHGADMTKWRWGEEHRAILTHKVFKHIPILSWASDLSQPSHGDYYTIDRGGSFGIDPKTPFQRTHGGGYRAIYDLSDMGNSRFMIATGQSGHILSKHYGDFVHRWNDVKYITFPANQAKDADTITFSPDAN